MQTSYLDAGDPEELYDYYDDYEVVYDTYDEAIVIIDHSLNSYSILSYVMFYSF